MVRPRLLFLSHNYPFPPDSGAKLRTFNTLAQLAKAFDVTALCFRRTDIPAELLAPPDYYDMQLPISMETFAVPQQHNKLRLLWDHLRSVALGRAYTRYVYDSADFRRHFLKQIRHGSFDLVHLDSLDLSLYLDYLGTEPVVCTHHNVESALLAQRAKSQRGTVTKLYFKWQAMLMRREERKWGKRVRLNVMVSMDDEAALKVIAGARCRTAVVPNGVDTMQFQPWPGPVEGVVSTGSMSWFPNWDAAHFFANDILPAICHSSAPGPVRWVGYGSPEQQQLLESCDVELTGHVPDVRPYVARAACFVVPVRVGGGTRVKILDAWAMGKAVVSTSIGCAGLRAIDDENLLIRDDPLDFADAVVQVLHDKNLRDRLGRSGRATVETYYDWSSIGREMGVLYLNLLNA